MLPQNSLSRFVNAGFLGFAALMAGSGAVLWAKPDTGVVLLLGGVSYAALGVAYLVVRRLLAQFRMVSCEIETTADNVANAAAELFAASQTLVRGVSTQSDSLCETSGTSELMASITRQSAETSRSAMELMNGADRLANQATQGLEVMLRSIGEISASAGKISSITKVVDEIAFQTNILALNAAVEAARAGESGAGFAVVADEVRNLAQRSAQAARDIAGLVGESMTRTQEGTSELDQVSIAVRALIENTAHVKALVDEVTMSSEELAKGSEQISASMRELEDVTKTTAASSEQAAATSREMNDQAAGMRQLVSGLRAYSGGKG